MSPDHESGAGLPACQNSVPPAAFDWAEAKRIFAEAVERSPADRAAYVAQVCAPDSPLYREVVSLLENHHGTAETFFEPPPSVILSPVPDPMVGRRIGAYHILRRIGAGGMGAVYLAERADEQFRKLVALKIVRPEVLNEQAFRRFQNERQTLAVLDHPNIIRLLDGGTTEDGVPYLVTEHVAGEPIDSYCTGARLTVAERLVLFRTVLGAVHYAHQNLVVHRDLKPANILVTAGAVPKLLDFGIAKLLRPEYSAQAMGLTRSAMQPMTPDFASPEQVRGLPITTASDIYSLGVILYCLLAGRHPFEDQRRTAFELGHAICETDPERPSKFAARAETPAKSAARTLRGDLDTIVLKAMRREPRHRYASVEHFAEDIRRYLEGFPVAARQAGVWYKASKFVSRHKLSTAGVALLTAGLAMTSALAVEQYRTASRRFTELRQFSDFVINNLDKALRDGSTPARKLMAEQGVEYLDKLARERGSDRSIMRDLVNGYIHMGDVEGNLYGASLGDTAGAEQAYRKALALAEELVRTEPSNPNDKSQLVTALQSLGETLAASGNRPEAMHYYDEVQRILEAERDAATPTDAARYETANLWLDMGSTRLQLSDPAGALDSFRHALQAAERLSQTYPNRANIIALLREQAAIAAARTGNPTGAEESLRESIAIYQGRKPSPKARRTLAKAYKNLAEVQQLNGHSKDALASIRQSLRGSEELLASDSKNTQYRIDLQQALMMAIDLLNANGLTAEARAQTVRALAMTEAFANEAGAPYQPAADYAELLATTAFRELRNPPAALRYARKAAAMTRETDPDVMHVLALAYEADGDRQRAFQAADKALALLPAGRPSLFQRKLQSEVDRLSK